MPFWKGAIENPQERFKKTYNRIFAAEDQQKITTKRDQIGTGITAGYDEICKLYQILLKAQMKFLATMDPKVGPSILRVILALVEREEVNINRSDTMYDDADYGVVVDDDLEWGTYNYDDDNERPEEEKIWYDWLFDDRAIITH